MCDQLFIPKYSIMKRSAEQTGGSIARAEWSALTELKAELTA